MEKKLEEQKEYWGPQEFIFINLFDGLYYSMFFLSKDRCDCT